ncbi:MAG TPA: MFS transporter [Terriglobales bacterium]|nr:MFS transporter [Terriglobales bacterium]
MVEARSSVSPESSRNIRAFGATSFLNDTASEMAYWVLPAFLASIGAGPAKLGLIEGIAESVASFAKFFSGYLADRIPRRKPIVVGGYVVANAVKPLLALATSWWPVLFIRFADRFSKGIRGTARDVMVAEAIKQERLGSAYGLIQAMDSAGAIAGPLAALFLLSRYGHRGVFWAAGIPGLFCILVAVFGIHETRRASRGASQADIGVHGRGTPDQNSWFALRANFPAAFYYVLFAVTLFSLGNSSDMFLVLRAQNIGIAASRAPMLGLVFNITYTLISWPAGLFSDRFSRRVIAAAGYLVFAVVYFVFGLAPSKLAIWSAMAFYGLFYALTNPVLKALVVDTVSESVRGRALGLYFFVTSIATLLASILTGELWKYFGPAVPFYFSAAIAVLSTLLLLASRRQPLSNK